MVVLMRLILCLGLFLVSCRAAVAYEPGEPNFGLMATLEGHARAMAGFCDVSIYQVEFERLAEVSGTDRSHPVYIESVKQAQRSFFENFSRRGKLWACEHSMDRIKISKSFPMDGYDLELGSVFNYRREKISPFRWGDLPSDPILIAGESSLPFKDETMKQLDENTGIAWGMLIWLSENCEGVSYDLEKLERRMERYGLHHGAWRWINSAYARDSYHHAYDGAFNIFSPFTQYMARLSYVFSQAQFYAQYSSMEKACRGIETDMLLEYSYFADFIKFK